MRDQRDAILGELAWCSALSHEGIDRLKYRAMLLVLRDLMGQGWHTQYRPRNCCRTSMDWRALAR
jgi:hypothetical protein